MVITPKNVKTFFFVYLVFLACELNTFEYYSQVSAYTPSLVKSSSAQNFTNSLPHPIFSSILPRIRVKTKLYARLPAYIPESDGSNSIYALLETVTHSKYLIMLAFSKDCNGGNACRLGSVSGEAITSKFLGLKGKTVSLAKGITGYFVDANCGATCSDSTLTWDQNGGRYTVAIKAGKLKTLVRMANSAIKAA